MGVEKFIIDVKLNKSNPGDLYRPPALRNHYVNEELVNKTNQTTTTVTSGEEVISCATSDNISSNTSSITTTTTTSTTTTSISCNNSPIHRNDNVNIKNNNGMTTTSTQQSKLYTAEQQKHHVDEQQQQQIHQPQRQQQQQQPQSRRERRPDRAVYIPRARRSQTTPPNTATTTTTTIQIQQPQIQQPQQTSPHQAQHQQLAPTITGNTTTTTLANHTSKSISQQLAITYDDTTSASVNQKPSSKADEVGKLFSGSNNISTGTSTTTTIVTKKKEKLNKENKESREQRREQRLLRKSLSATNTTTASVTSSLQQYHSSKNNTKFCENSNNDESKSVIVNGSQKETTTTPLSPLSINVNNFSSECCCHNENESEQNLNLIIKSKVNKCDSSSEKQLQLIENLKNSQLQQQQSCFITTTTNNLNSFEQTNNIETNDSLLNEFEISKSLSESFVNQTNVDLINCVNTKTNNFVTTTNFNNSNNNNNIIMPKKSTKSTSNKISTEMDNNLRIEDVAPQQKHQHQLPPTKKCDIEEQELQRASKEINRSNRRIMKQTFVSDILQIPDHIDEEENVEAKSKNASVNKISNNTQRTNQIDSNTEEDEEEEEEEDDWENMYNDTGDCLDPKIMQELTASVGKCKIELPKMDYSAFLTKQSILNDEEFPHVLEVSNFPVEFKNQDLLMVFSQYKESGFDIKWVDDTHALAVFSSSRIAAEVLTMGHPFVVLKPLAEATVESRMKAKKCAASLQPYRPRPQTCAALARRLVTGALGVRLKTAAAERENEKRVLHEAKERKLLAAKQRDEVWES